jgi:excinuclease UvrABC nuclease subunit
MAELYRHYNGEGQLIYVGCSLSSVARLAQHREHSHWFSNIARVTIQRFETRQEALAEETRAIRSEHPLYNKHHNHNPPPPSNAQESKDQITRQVVFRPMYKIEDAAAVLEIGPTAVKRAVEQGLLGSVQMGGYARITGWQLIDFIEWLESAKR